MELSDPIRLALLIGANIFGVYAFYKVVQFTYWFIKDKTSSEEL